MFFKDSNGADLPYSEDGPLVSCQRTEARFSSLSKKLEWENRWVYARVTKMAILPYACTVAGLISGLFAHVTVLVGCGIPMESAEDAACLCMPLLAAFGGMALAWKINLPSYSLLVLVLSQRPDIYLNLTQLAEDDPVIRRPFERMTRLLRQKS